MNVQIEESWKAHLKPEFDKDYFSTLTDFVKSEYSQYQIFPPGKLIFNAFNLDRKSTRLNSSHAR